MKIIWKIMIFSPSETEMLILEKIGRFFHSSCLFRSSVCWIDFWASCSILFKFILLLVDFLCLQKSFNPSHMWLHI